MVTEAVLLEELEAAKRTDHALAIHDSTSWTAPPTRKANGKMNAAIFTAVFMTCSLAIIKLAKQGMKRVMVIVATKICGADEAVAASNR